MRFRAGIQDVATFFRITQAIEKLQKKCIIKLTESIMHIICNSEANEGGIQVWTQVKVDTLFVNYRIQSNSDNEITISLSPEALLSALRSATSSSSPTSTSSFETDEVVMKLAKKHDHAVLLFEISGFTRVGRRVRVAHDVKIEILKPSDVARMAEPLCPDPDVHVVLPPLQKLRTIVERMRPMSDILAVRANNKGRLWISINTEGVKVDTEWRNCTNPRAQSDNPEEEANNVPPDPDKVFTVLLSIRSFLKFLNSHVVSRATIACICHNHCMILYVYVGDVEDAGGVLTFYIPAIVDDEG